MTKNESALEKYRHLTQANGGLTLHEVANALNIPEFRIVSLINFLRDKSFFSGPIWNPKVAPAHLNKVNVVTYQIDCKYGVKTDKGLNFNYAGLQWLIENLKEKGYDVQGTAEELWDAHNFSYYCE